MSGDSDHDHAAPMDMPTAVAMIIAANRLILLTDTPISIYVSHTSIIACYCVVAPICDDYVTKAGLTFK